MYFIIFFMLLCQISLSKPNEFSKDLIDSLSQKISKDIALKLVESKLAFKINTEQNSNYSSYFQNKISNELSNLPNFNAVDTAIISINNCNVVFEVINDKEDSLKRITFVEIYLNTQKNNSQNLKFSSKAIDIVKVKDADYLNQTLPNPKPILPNSQNDWAGFKKITEAIVVTCSAAVAVLLFFAVRSK